MRSFRWDFKLLLKVIVWPCERGSIGSLALLARLRRIFFFGYTHNILMYFSSQRMITVCFGMKSCLSPVFWNPCRSFLFRFLSEGALWVTQLPTNHITYPRRQKIRPLCNTQFNKAPQWNCRKYTSFLFSFKCCGRHTTLKLNQRYFSLRCLVSLPLNVWWRKNKRNDYSKSRAQGSEFVSGWVAAVSLSCTSTTTARCELLGHHHSATDNGVAYIFSLFSITFICHLLILQLTQSSMW